MSLTNFKSTTKYLLQAQLYPNVIEVIQSYLKPSFGDIMLELESRYNYNLLFEDVINHMFGIDKVRCYRWYDIFKNVKVSNMYPRSGLTAYYYREYRIEKPVSDMWLWNRRRVRGSDESNGRLNWYCEVNGISKRKGFRRWNKKQKIRALLEL